MDASFVCDVTDLGKSGANVGGNTLRNPFVSNDDVVVEELMVAAVSSSSYTGALRGATMSNLAAAGFGLLGGADE